MASEDEVDYMSDSFLQSICGKEDVRPGLIKSHAQKHVHKVAASKIKSDEKNQLRNPSLKQKEAESRTLGLSKPLDSDNVGFKMLQKLGFKPGAGLGRSGEGRIEPVAVEVKADRQGLGRKRSLEEIAKMREMFRAEARDKALNVDDYRMRKAEKAAEKRASLDLMKSQRVCWDLDSKECIDEPAESWFWPDCKIPKNEDDVEEEETPEQICQEDSQGSSEMLEGEESEKQESQDVNDDEEFTVQEKLEILTHYLRRTYLYCIWCGHSFDDEKDLEQDCPGPTREDH